MPSVAKYRRTWFALLREAGIPEEDRHWIQEEYTGKASTKDWSRRDWEQAIATLQRHQGDHNDHHAHVREDRQGGVADESGDRATSAQCELIEELSDEIAWRTDRESGPIRYLCRSSLKGPRAALRRKTLRARYEEGARGYDLWQHLDRKEAADFIRALKSLKHRSPATQEIRS